MIKKKINLGSLIQNRNTLSVFVSMFIFSIVLVISSSDVLYLLNKKIQNTFYSIDNKASGSKVSKNIIVVEIDDKTLQDGVLGRFPFDRKDYIPVINNLKEAGALIIGFDIILNEKTPSDALLADAIKKADNIIVGGYIDTIGANDDNDKKLFRKSIFSDEIKTTGFVNPVLDEYNLFAYSITPFKELKNGVYTHFSISILKYYYSLLYNKNFSLGKQNIDENYYYITPTRKIPLSRKGKKEILINYIDSNKFTKVSFIDVYDKNKFDTLRRYTDFEDKIILIGASAKGLKDIFYTPNGIEPGVYTHANMINTVLTKNYIQYFNKNVEYFLLFLLILVSVYFNLSRSGYILIASNISISIIFLLFFPFIIINYTYFLLNFPIELILSLIISLTVSNIVKYLIENKHKVKLNKALSEYVSKDIAHEILSGEGKINLNGENKDISIFFSDIEGFTSISEKFSPEKLVGFLREYLGKMSDIIMDEKGFINKYEGDAIMALWGVFGNNNTYTYEACLSALKQQSSLKQLNIKWKEKGFSEIKVRIGIHVGSAIIGNIGSEGRKMEFTALGDSVNLASRLEGVNKFYGTYICVSQDIYDKEKDNFEFRYLDIIRVKGKEEAIKIYELLSLKGELNNNKKEIISDFAKAINLYKKKEFGEALFIFKKLRSIGDSPSKNYILRCENYIKTPPLDSWDGIWRMESK